MSSQFDGNVGEREPEGFVEKDRSRGKRRETKRRTLDGRRIHDPGKKKDRFRFDSKVVVEDEDDVGDDERYEFNQY